MVRRIATGARATLLNMDRHGSWLLISGSQVRALVRPPIQTVAWNDRGTRRGVRPFRVSHVSRCLTGSMPPMREQADEGFGERAALSRLNGAAPSLLSTQKKAPPKRGAVSFRTLRGES